mmetsp:Transcript_91087/g.262620  ORF Transcript_91087/g.262620 Transcript_91087/m.262620 type:complete len:440 (+) Transcript_91087:527-1846(+)
MTSTLHCPQEAACHGQALAHGCDALRPHRLPHRGGQRLLLTSDTREDLRPGLAAEDHRADPNSGLTCRHDGTSFSCQQRIRHNCLDKFLLLFEIRLRRHASQVRTHRGAAIHHEDNVLVGGALQLLELLGTPGRVTLPVLCPLFLRRTIGPHGGLGHDNPHALRVARRCGLVPHATSRACAPRRPIGEHTALPTRLEVACPGLCGRTAASASMDAHSQRRPCPVLLAAAALTRAAGPLRPLAHLAVDRARHVIALHDLLCRRADSTEAAGECGGVGGRDDRSLHHLLPSLPFCVQARLRTWSDGPSCNLAIFESVLRLRWEKLCEGFLPRPRHMRQLLPQTIFESRAFFRLQRSPLRGMANGPRKLRHLQLQLALCGFRLRHHLLSRGELHHLLPQVGLQRRRCFAALFVMLTKLLPQVSGLSIRCALQVVCAVLDARA